MSALVTIREYARLTTAAVAPGNLDCVQITESAFEWLCELSASFNRNGATLLQLEGRRSLRWDSYVGVLETPCGTRLEILPKHHEQDDCVLKSRRLLRKLIQHALQLKPREASVTSLELFDAPLSEWVMGQFLAELDLLVKRGVRFDYQRIEEEQRFCVASSTWWRRCVSHRGGSITSRSVMMCSCRTAPRTACSSWRWSM